MIIVVKVFINNIAKEVVESQFNMGHLGIFVIIEP